MTRIPRAPENPTSLAPAGRLRAHASVVLLALVGSIGVIVATPASAGAASKPPEFEPRSYLHRGESCRKAEYWPWGDRCWKFCPRSHAALPSAHPDGEPDEVRCVKRRTTRLFYGLKLTARYRYEHGNVVIGAGVSQPPDRGYEETTEHEWTFRPRNEAVTLFRQCTMRSSQELVGISLLIDPAIECERQERALRSRKMRFSLSEDVSLRAAGTLDGGAFRSSITEDLLETYWYENGQRVSVPCFNALTTAETANGPTGVPAVLVTPARSSRFYGLQFELEGGGPRAPVTSTGTGRLCPPLPKDAKGHPDPTVFDPPTSPTKPFAAPSPGQFLDRPKGIEILNLFKPNLDQKFGDARIRLEDTVERGTDSDPQLGTYERLDITLELTRCKRQAPPSRCAARR
jgi:hypothetical protein